VYALDAEPTTMNPLEASDPASRRAIQFFFPNLYQVDKSLGPIPDLADGMPQISPDGKTYTVHIRRGAKWSDGSPITAGDVATTDRIEAQSNFDNGTNFDWLVLTDPVTGIEKVDDFTVRYFLSSRYAPFTANSLVGPVVPAKVYGKIDPAVMGRDVVTRDHPVLTGGPFRYVKRLPGREIDGQANPDFYAGRPHYDALSLKVVTGGPARLTALRQGAIGVDPQIAGDDIDAIKGAAMVNLYVYPDLGYYDVRFNERPGRLFADLRVRQAWEYVIDHDGVVNAATKGQGTPVYGDIPKASWAYDAGAARAYPQRDVARAQELLTAAGWVKGPDGTLAKGGKRFAADFCVRSDTPQRMAAVNAMAREAATVGMALTAKPLDFTVFYKPKSQGGCGIFDGDFDIAFAGWSLVLDPDDSAIFASSSIRSAENPSGQNFTGFSDPALDAALDKERTDVQATEAATRAARRADMAHVERLLRQNVVVYFMWSDNIAQAFADRVKGVEGGGSGQDLTYADQDRNTRVFASWYSGQGR
jgi:peptide/nickel transport system substrate-binding protein